MGKNSIKVALIGNPNVGKTSVFNQLTGLNQQVGNYPGITVDKKMGVTKLNETVKAHIIDLPGTYSLNASSIDENVVIELLLNKNDVDFPNVAIVVTEVENLKRNLLLFTQIKDLEIPTLLVINMIDRMKLKGIELDIPKLERELKTKIALVSSRKNIGIDYLKELILNYKNLSTEPCLHASSIDPDYFNKLRKAFPNQLLYKLWLVITQDVNFLNLERNAIQSSFTKTHAELKKLQQKETIKRYQFINDTLKIGQRIDKTKATDIQNKLDRVLTHKFFGYVIFLGILLLIFQSIFDWSSIPMEFIDNTFANLSAYARESLPAGKFTDLVSDGIIPGIGGIVIFIPQIAFLFLFISVLEESGYMSRVVFLMDKIMRKFGLSGKSIVPLISGTACAIPAIMGARNIENWKERLVTILVTPLITCSARLPVYAILIALIIPEKRVWGLSLQGLTLMSLYFIAFIMAILSAYILNKVLKLQCKSYFVVEMPSYKIPMFKNVAINVLEKTKAFITGAGKIILALSIILWFLGSHGPNENFDKAQEIIEQEVYTSAIPINPSVIPDRVAEYKLEHSYIGYMGKSIEPVIKPLGYDWKIGVAIVSSFAAREVFVGTLATIYSVGSQGKDNATIKHKMAADINPETGEKIFNFATGISLLLFYAFAMQCISTLAIVKKETNSWKWPLAQLIGMSGFAYVVALIAYQLLK
ncbi:ferrous iron transport protein B [Flavobacterium sp. 20NA77.7]|uniref:Ferrous iron transport protein B n=1 Tax=Flavobacterium nakdongensis TaxID=3073563 RepID=A0ABY9R9V5_9FLAO|nr:ferrous iron transport protein B [Flavobacterium sp. 20NA77.7]WMW78020.1 ferrous iron transport protein B [Flavobacterium sp. 20NA77.7]